MKKGDIVVRDVRVKDHFVVDDQYLNGFAAHCGGSATMVYLCLCRHADIGQKSFPSLGRMAEKTGMSVSSVQRALIVLISCKIISKDRVRNPETGRWWHNSYYLLDKSQWVKTPQVTGDQRSKRPSTTGHPRPTKDSHVFKDSHKYTANAEFIIKEDTEKPPRTKKEPVTKKYDELCDWLRSLTGAPLPNRPKQYRHLADARAADIEPKRLKQRAEELWSQTFFRENGMDWGSVVSSFNRKA